MLPVGGGQLYLEPRHLNFDDRTQHTPNSDTTWLTGEFVHPIGNRADVSAAYDRITTSVSGRDTANWNIFRFQGTLETTRRVFFDAFYRQQGINLPFTQTTYENRSSLVGVNVSAYPGTHSSVRAGLFREDLRREDGTTGQTTNSRLDRRLTAAPHQQPGSVGALLPIPGSRAQARSRRR